MNVFNPVLFVATDTDILAMLVNQANGTHGVVYMGRGLASRVNILDIQEKIGALKTYLLSNRAVSRCDSESMHFGK